MFSLQNKITLVTGAGSGIGAAIAETFARAGAFVFVTDRDEKTGRAVSEKIKAQDGDAEFLPLDVTSEENCQRVGQAVVLAKGRLDILVNNAGIGHVGTMLQTTGADLDRLYAVNVRGVFNVTKVMALDHAQYGIRVNCICPGRVETPFVAARLAEYPDPDKARQEMSATQALGRMGKPEEIAAAALYLASDESAFVTGTEFIIDGGFSAGK